MEAQDLVKIRSNHLWSCVITHDQAPLRVITKDQTWLQLFNFVVCLNSVFCAKNHYLITLDQAHLCVITNDQTWF